MTRLALALALAVAVLLAAASADAAVLCQATKGDNKGALYLRDACKKKETPVDPVALGLQGPQGTPGAAGAQGPAGPTGPQGPSGEGLCTPTYTDNGDGTVTDSCTSLQWEKKTNLDSVLNPTDPHDADNTYTWCADDNPRNGDCDNPGYPPDGAAFTVFLAALNTAPCFAGHCDWRLPDVNELRTLLLQQQYPCTLAFPCIASELGPTVSSYYWSSSSFQGRPGDAWDVNFTGGGVANGSKPDPGYVRAVRGGS